MEKIEIYFSVVTLVDPKNKNIKYNLPKGTRIIGNIRSINNYNVIDMLNNEKQQMAQKCKILS